MDDLRTQLEELKKRLEVLEESIDPVDELMLSIRLASKNDLREGPTWDRRGKGRENPQGPR